MPTTDTITLQCVEIRWMIDATDIQSSKIDR